VFGAHEVAKIERGRYDLFATEFLAPRVAAGDRAIVQLNHPKTFRLNTESLKGSFDQIFDVLLSDLPKAGEAKKKFSDYGLDDFSPLRDVRASWVSGAVEPDRAVVAETLQNMAASMPQIRLMEVLLARGTEFSSEVPRNPSLVAGDEEGTLVRRTKVHSDYDYYLLHGCCTASAWRRLHPTTITTPTGAPATRVVPR
jgi:hypothetical protein